MISAFCCGVAAANLFERRAMQAEILGRQRQAANDAVAQLGNVGLARDRDFVEAIGAVHHEGAFHAQLAERSRQQLRIAFIVDADDLRRGSGGIRERAEQIENGAHLEFAASGHRVARRGVHGRREEESDADPFDCGGDSLGREIDAHAEMLEDVRRAAARADRAIAVFGDAHARARNDERCGGRNVERARSVAAGAAGVDERLIRDAQMTGENRRSVAPHGRREADQFVDRLALHAQAGEERGNLRIGGEPGEDILHRGLGLGAGKVFIRDDFFERFVDHRSSGRERIRLIASMDAGKLLRLHRE